jgi:hypothetical protein
MSGYVNYIINVVIQVAAVYSKFILWFIGKQGKNNKA